MRKSLMALLVLIGANAFGQTSGGYKYSVDLKNIKDDQLHIELVPPKLTASEVTFFLPKIIPGTYANADYGKFVHNLKVTDKSGRPMTAKQLTENSWLIKNAPAIGKIAYDVEDTWESKLPHIVYDMGGTNIEAGKNFVLNTPGFFGFFKGMTKVPYELTITKPENLYASTPLIAKSSEKEKDVFLLKDADHLYDSPIMYSVPDTTTIHLANTKVLISVYSPNKAVTSKAIATLLYEMLSATQAYLGGKLPVEKYAFIYYFNGEQEPLKSTGALEHNYSSFYALPEIPFDNIAPTLLDISAHEFFHIVTPLTISSKEIKDFNFTEPVMSKHLWLYEGSTEYAAHHVQVVEGLNTPEQFLEKMSEKIYNSKTSYNDELPFTELSKHSADKHHDQYNNVYEKGALISACLDLYLLQLSGGNYGIRNLKHDLSIKYGKDKYFNDDELFDEIAKLTYPEVRGFFKDYLESPNMIPYDKFFGIAGVALNSKKVPSIGNVQLGGSENGNVVVAGTETLNEFGKKVGYQVGDEFVSFNGAPFSMKNAQQVLDDFRKNAKEGEKVEMVVLRKNESGEKKEVTLSAPVSMLSQYSLQFMDNATPEQLAIRKAWLDLKGEDDTASPTPQADNNDVSSVDAVVNALYASISGPAGPRNWDRFLSLFYPGAKMAAVMSSPQGEEKFQKFSPDDYAKMNDPYFQKFDFVEKELHRVVNNYGSICQVFSSYEYTLKTPQQTVTQRGINSIELVKDNNRWWITSFTWDDESPNNPLPAAYTGQAPEPEKATTKSKKKK